MFRIFDSDNRSVVVFFALVLAGASLKTLMVFSPATRAIPKLLFAILALISLVSFRFEPEKIWLGFPFLTLRLIDLMGASISANKSEVSSFKTFFSFLNYLSFSGVAVGGPHLRASDWLLASQKFDIRRLVRTDFLKLVFGLIILTQFVPLMSDAMSLLKLGFLKYFAFDLVFLSYLQIQGATLCSALFCKAFGVTAPVSFNKPWLSSDLLDFWRRWNISVSSWFRDRIYLPLNFFLQTRYEFVSAKYSNAAAVMATFLTMSLWHGLSIGWLAYGLTHAIATLGLTSIDQSSAKKELKMLRIAFRYFNYVTTFLIVSFAFSWVRK